MGAMIEQLSSLLKESGGWGLSAILLFFVWKMILYIREQHGERIEESKSSYELLVGMKLVLESHEKAYDRFVQKLESIYEAVKEEGE